MIAKISSAKNLSKGLNYNLTKVKKGDAYILYGSNLPFNSDKAANLCKDDILHEFSKHLKILNKCGRTKKPIVHISLNPSPDDDVSDTTYSYIAEDYLQNMGFVDVPFVVFKHEDIDRHHIHILTTNVRADGTKINDSFSHRKSVKICEKLEKEYGLTPAKHSERKVLQDEQDSTRDFLLTNYLFDVRKDGSSTQIRQIVRLTNKKYHFETDKEYNALLRLFGVEADFKQESTKGKRGVVFYGLDSNGRRITKPIRSFLIEKGLLSKLEKKFKKSKTVLADSELRQAIRSKLDIVKAASSKIDFYEKFALQNMDIVFRRNQSGRIYGATIVDHDTGVVLNGSKLSKAYSANVFNDLFNSYDSAGFNSGGRATTAEQKHDSKQEISSINHNAELTFGGSAGGFGHYQRVGDNEKESENDKLNREIQKRKKKKSYL